MEYFWWIFTGLMCLLLQTQIVSSDHDEDSWVEPNAWAQYSEDEDPLNGKLDKVVHGSGPEPNVGKTMKCACDEKINSEDAVALTYFRKFIATLFNREKLKYVESASHYQLSMVFTLLPAQLERLEQISDPRDLDITLSEIFKKARIMQYGSNFNSSKDNMGIGALIWDILKDALQLLRSNEIRFALIVLFTIIFGWIIHRYYGISILVLILGGGLLFGYFHTYLECNRKLEMEDMLEVYEQGDQNASPEETSWFSRLTFGIFSGKPTQKEVFHKKMKKAAKVKLPFCRPDHVLLMYGNDLFLTQIQFLFEKCVSTMSTLTGTLSFPYSLFAPIFLLGFLAYVVKLTFKYILSPRAWAELVHRRNTEPAAALHPAAQQNAIAAGEDRISGQNLRLLLSIAAVGGSTGGGEPLAVSGVQEVMEALEAPSSKSTSSQTNSPNNSQHEELFNTSQSPQKLSNNNNDKIAKDKSIVTLEDASPDD